jgi:hypothetical protein
MFRAGKRECRTTVAGSSRFNVGGIEIAKQADLFRAINDEVCSDYARCREPSGCDRAVFDGLLH